VTEHITVMIFALYIVVFIAVSVLL